MVKSNFFSHIRKNYFYFFLISSIIFLFDRLTKIFFVNNGSIYISKFFNFFYTENTGAAFGIFNNMNFVLGLFNLLIISFIIYYIFKYDFDFKILLGLSFVVGGSLANAFDRLFIGFVVDFISIYKWPNFNVADSFIVLGFMLLIFLYFKQPSLFNLTKKMS